MTRKSKRELERLIEEFENAPSIDDELGELSDAEREQVDQLYADARDVLTDEECARIDELEDQIELNPDSETGAGLSDAKKEYFDLIFRVTAERRLEGCGLYSPT